MFEQVLIDAVVVLGLFVLRVGVPVAIVFGLARWLEKKLRAQETPEIERRGASARIIPFVRPQPHAAPIAARAEKEIGDKRASAK